MKSSKIKRISALTAVSALALSGLAFASSAFAVDPTPTATPTISAMPGGDGEDAGQLDEGDVVLNQADDQQVGDSVEGEQGDSEVDSMQADDAQEQGDFQDDADTAAQLGDTEAAAELTAAASDVVSVTAPVVQAMTADNSQAHTLITGATIK